jgi:hypothetical protein
MPKMQKHSNPTIVPKQIQQGNICKSKTPQGQRHILLLQKRDVEVLKTLLLNKGFSLSTDKAKSGQTGQNSNIKKHDLQLKDSNLIFKNKWAGSSVRIEHHPPKVGVVGSNPTPPAGF